MKSNSATVSDSGARPVVPVIALVILFAWAFWTFAFFLTPLPGDNVNSRLDLTSAIINERSLSIDAYHSNTIDKAFINGRYYSDKAPGVSLAALPVAALFKRFESALPGNSLFRYASTAFAVSLPAALMVVVFFIVAFRVTRDATLSFLCTFALACGTLFLPYSTLFYGHAPGAAISFFLFYILFTDKNPSTARMLFAGFLGAWMVVVDYTLATHSIILLALATIQIKNKTRMLLLLPGAVVAAAALLYYNKFAFGDFFTLGYMHESYASFASAHSNGALGFSTPSAASFYEILLKPGQSLLFLSPFLIFSIPGFFIGFKNHESRGAIIAAGLIVVVDVVINASYFMPMGGASPGPRHLVAMIPYATLLCAYQLRQSRDAARGFFLGLVIASAAALILVTVSNPHVPVGIDATLTEYSIPLLTLGVARDGLLGVFFKGASPALTVLFYLAGVFALFSASIRLANFGARKPGFTFIASCAFAIALIAAMHFATNLSTSGCNASEKSYLIGRTCFSLGRTRLARTQYERTIALRPDHALANFGLGSLDASDGNVEMAISRFKKSVESNPSFSVGHFNLALLLHSTGALDEAYAHYAACIQTNHLHNSRLKARALAAMSSILYKQGRESEAEQLLRAADALSN